MLPQELEGWERRFESFLRRKVETDPSHGFDHIKRVVASARRIARSEDAQLEIVVPAAWFHDCVMVEKDSPDRSKASTFAAAAARDFLAELGYPTEHLGDIAHCIKAHSFSAGIEPKTLEARVLQDADRLDAVGAIGLARALMIGGRLGRPIYHAEDPFCEERDPDDAVATLDHFYVKLLKLPGTMQTGSGRLEAERRAKFLKLFLEQLESELPTRH